MSYSKSPDTTPLMGESKDSLLAWLQENPKTFGWDAVVVYNRGRANALLMQQYLKKLTADNYLTPIDGQIAGPEGSKLNFFGIQLGIPRLSFDNADIEHSEARITQAITAGLAILKSEPVGGYKGIHSIMRPNGAAGPTLWMDVDLEKTDASISDAGSVQIDLKNMTKFNTDLFSDDVSIINAQNFFLERFNENPKLQIYTLGELNKEADSTLTPESFEIRTQSAPGAKSRAAPNFGDGAVVLFVALKGGAPSGTPTKNSDFRYLIPNDEDGTKYSSAVLLSNKVLFNALLLQHLSSIIPGITLTPKSLVDDEGNPGHIYLECTAGAINKTDYKFVANGYYSDYIVTASNPLIVIPLQDAKFQAVHNTINFAWAEKSFTIDMHYHNTRGENNDSHKDESLSISVHLDLTSAPGIDPENGTIHFEQAESTDAQIEINVPSNHYAQNQDSYLADLRNIFKSKLLDFTKTITIPDIDTFLLRNLLFPDNNAMVLTDAHVPGDLAVFGNVDPSLTSFVIEPEHAILNPGASQSFKVQPTADVTWSVEALPGDNRPVGTITEGVYTAPSQEEFQAQEAQQVIITASGTTARGLAASSSTLVSIVSQTISLNPIFSVCSPELPLQFTAGSLDDRPLKWAMKDPGQGGTLEPDTGLTVTYTAPPAAPGMFTLEVIEVRDDQGNMGQADVLVINKQLGGQVEVDFAQANNGKAQLKFMKQYDGGPIQVPTDKLAWALLTGPGSVDDQGIYTEPQQQMSGFAVITCEFAREPEFEGAPPPVDYGYTVLPLPLAQYPDLKRAF